MNKTRQFLTILTTFWLGSALANEPAKDPHSAAKKQIAESKCEACHAKKISGDGTGIYTRANRIVKTKARVTAQVALCNTELNLGLFPEDEAAIAAYLNDTFYKFK